MSKVQNIEYKLLDVAITSLITLNRQRLAALKAHRENCDFNIVRDPADAYEHNTIRVDAGRVTGNRTWIEAHASEKDLVVVRRRDQISEFSDAFGDTHNIRIFSDTDVRHFDDIFSAYPKVIYIYRASFMSESEILRVYEGTFDLNNPDQLYILMG